MSDLSPTPVSAAVLPPDADTGHTLPCGHTEAEAQVSIRHELCQAPEVFELDVPMHVARLGADPVPPLTANQRLHWRDEARRVRWIRESVMRAAKFARVPKGRHITVTLHYRPGDNRRRDADNLAPTLKAACDALARGPRRDWVGLELVPDDTPEHMTKRMPVIHPGPGERRLWLEVVVQR